MARNLKAPISTFDLTFTRHVASFRKFMGCFRIVSSRDLERRVVRLSAAICLRVMTWGHLTPPGEGGGGVAGGGGEQQVAGGEIPQQLPG